MYPNTLVLSSKETDGADDWLLLASTMMPGGMQGGGQQVCEEVLNVHLLTKWSCLTRAILVISALLTTGELK